mgnify:CR=1 FL=1
MLAARTQDELKLGSLQREGRGSPTQVASKFDSEPWYVMEVSGDELESLVNEAVPGPGVWIACSMLPEFMDVRKYGK